MIFSYFKQQRFASIFLLLALLFVTVSHSHEYSSDVSIVEQPDCKLCQQFVELPQTSIEPVDVTFGYFSSVYVRVINVIIPNDNYCQGNPRAPPVIT